MKRAIRRTRGDWIFDLFLYTLFAAILLIVAYPLYFVFIASVSDPVKTLNGEVWFFVKGFQADGYRRIFEDARIWTGYRNSILYAGLGTLLNVTVTLLCAYPLSREDFPARHVILMLFVFTMYFSGGLIPTYLVVRQLGLVRKWQVLILLGMVSPWNLILTRTYFKSNDTKALQEAAHIDGCSDIRFFVSILLPLSKAIVAVLALYYCLSHWNGYFNALIYLSDPQTFPLQLVLREILIVSSRDNVMMTNVEDLAERMRVAEVIKYGVIIVASLPMLVLYPFLQKYFVKGVMIGSIKG